LIEGLAATDLTQGRLADLKGLLGLVLGLQGCMGEMVARATNAMQYLLPAILMA
jgi:hypothetical protein